MTKANKITRTFTGWRFELRFAWDERLGDIYLGGKCVDCLQVHDYDWETGKLTIRTRPQIKADFEEWILDNGKTFIEEYPYL